MLKKTLLIAIFFACKLNAQEVTQPSNEKDSIISGSRSEKTIKDRQSDKMYRVNYKTVVPIIAAGFAITAYDFSVIYKKKQTPCCPLPFQACIPVIPPSWGRGPLDR